MFNKLQKYLEDPLLHFMYSEIRKTGSIKSISVDLTSNCNLRCEGCYYFDDKMNFSVQEGSDKDFEHLIAIEKKRGTNFVTVVGGEPSLKIDRLKKLHNNFRVAVATNGQIKIPFENLENLSIGVAIWGNPETDSKLRGKSKINVFEKALTNYKNDPRAFFYYTVHPDKFNEIEETVELCINNGNRILFNYFGEVQNSDIFEDHPKANFEMVNQEVNRMIEKYPEHILLSSYISDVVTSRTLYDETWGHEVCPNFSVNNPLNFERMKTEKPFSKHFNAYNSDFTSTRKCCTRSEESCEECYDVWQHFAWIIINMKKHLNTKEEFTNWLSTTYLFYLINRIVDEDAGYKLLPEIHKRVLANKDLVI